MSMPGIRLQSVAYTPSAPVSNRTNGRKRTTIDASVGGKGIAKTGELLQDWGHSMEKIGDALMKADGISGMASGSALKSFCNPSTAGTAAQGASSGDSSYWSGFSTFFGSMFTGSGGK